MDLALCKTITTQGPCKRESTEALRCKKDAKHSRKAIWTATSLPFCLSFRTDPYSRTRFSYLIQRYTKLVQICTDVNIWTNSMCWYTVSFSMILIPHLFGLGQLVQVDPSKVRVGEGPDEDRRYCLYVATSETNSFNNWNSEKLLVMFSLNFELLIVSSSAWRRVSARRFGNTKHEGRGEKA